MIRNHLDILHQVNCLSNDLNALYHQAARKLGVSDSVLITVYEVYERGDGCLLSEIYKDSGVSKQTINSAIRTLEQEDILYLESAGGKMKRVRMTEKGREFVTRTASTLSAAECSAFDGWTAEELAQHVSLLARYNQAFRRAIEQMESALPLKKNTETGE